MTEKKQRGGRRTGAGRPPQHMGAKRTTVYLTPEHREHLAQIGDGNVTEGIRRLLVGLHRREHKGEILKRRNGKPVPDSAPLIREMREERVQ